MFAGCGTSVELQRGDIALEEIFQSSTFYLDVEDGSKTKPDNWDGYTNMIWTNDKKRAKVVSDHIQLLLDRLKEHGFSFVGKIDDSSVRASLKFKSVRFDPLAGWLTDDAQIAYSDTGSGEILGTVVADEIWITPTVKMVFEGLVQGSLELWGQATDD